jgi:branched-chain amino acid aminotransferase
MINFNGQLTDQSYQIENNRGFLYGDCVFESIRIIDGKICFWEDHYFRLISSMRILRIDIPDHFTPDFFESNIMSLHNIISKNGCSRVRLSVFRNSAGKYRPISNECKFLISCENLKSKKFLINQEPYKVDIFKEYYIDKQLISSLKSNNKIINVIASIYAKENFLDNCILLNNDKMVCEFINANLFLIKDGCAITPDLKSGCLNGVMRKNIIRILKKNNIETVERSIHSYEMIDSDEIFGCNSIQGIFSITEYRKNKLKSDMTKKILTILNEHAQL